MTLRSGPTGVSPGPSSSPPATAPTRPEPRWPRRRGCRRGDFGHSGQVPLPPMRLLITGGAGFIGPNFVRHALADGHEAVVYDTPTYAGDPLSLADPQELFTFVPTHTGDTHAPQPPPPAHHTAPT